MSPKDKTRHLDRMIKEMEQRRQARQAQGGGRGQGPPGGGPNGPWGPRDRSASSRDASRQERLDNTTPAERAQMTQFFRDLNARRQQLGLPTGGGRGFGPRP
jgi:hypothetical protein